MSVAETISARVLRLLDSFQAPGNGLDVIARYRLRLFVAANLFGPPAVVLLAAYAWGIEQNPPSAGLIAILAISLVNWTLAPLLRLTGRYHDLALASNLCFTTLVFVAAYTYGGVDSPFLALVVAIPANCFLFLDGERRLIGIGAMFSGLFALMALRYAGHSFPDELATDDLSWISIISIASGCAFSAMLTYNYAEMLRAALRGQEREIEVHRQTAEDLARARRVAEMANHAKSEFLANMSHELRTPLNAIMGFTDMMRSETLGPMGMPRYREYAEDVYNSADHLLAIINDLLDMSRLEAGKLELAEASVDMGEMIRGCRSMMQIQADMAGVQLLLEPLERPIRVLGDGRLLRQILLNLVSNAIKFTPFGGKVVVSCRLDDGAFELEVSDTGQGIQASELPRIMRPFEQVKRYDIRDHAGTGLGLPLSLMLAQLHDGDLELQSAQGQGTVATLRLPPERVLA